MLNAEWRPRARGRVDADGSVPPAQMSRPCQSSVVSSAQVIVCSAERLVNQSVQVDCVGLMCREVPSVADAAVEVGESLLAYSSQRHDRDVAETSHVVESLPSVTAAASVCGDAAAQGEPYQHGTVVACQNTPHCHPTGPSHVCETVPPIEIVPDECASPGYQLSCDGEDSSENNINASEPAENLLHIRSVV